MQKVLSVIIPVYNMEKYIRQCLESLMIREILDKIEILVVLDGLTVPVYSNTTIHRNPSSRSLHFREEFPVSEDPDSVCRPEFFHGSIMLRIQTDSMEHPFL